MSDAGFPIPPVDGTLRQALEGVRRAMQGKLNVRGTVTLTASTTTTAVTDERVSAQSYIGLMPTSSNAAAALATTYVSARDKGTFTLTHANNAQVDRTFVYIVIG